MSMTFNKKFLSPYAALDLDTFLPLLTRKILFTSPGMSENGVLFF